MKLPSGHRVLHFERIDSTNAEARRLAEAGGRGPLWIWADEQTGGRGRMGRSWVSEPGNLYATFLFAIATEQQAATQLSFVAALAVHDMAAVLRPEWDVRIKWPNDVLVEGAKFCGILAEVVGTAPTTIAIGCGVNVDHAPQGTAYKVTCLNSPFFPLREAGRVPSECEAGGGGALGEGPHPSRAEGGARHLPRFAEKDKNLTVESILQHLDLALSNRLQLWDEGRGFAAIRDAWLERAYGVGGQVAATDGISGTFTSIAADGALIVTLPGGSKKHIHSGEVRFAELESLRQS